jgi:hypothetical protein
VDSNKEVWILANGARANFTPPHLSGSLPGDFLGFGGLPKFAKEK